MGQTPSLPPQSQPGSALQLCLNKVFPSSGLLGLEKDVSYPQDLLYQAAVKPYNTDYHIIPAAVVRPSTSEDVAKVVRCAVNNAVKVQARSGGHSYGNYCLGGESGAVVVDLVKFQKFSMNKTTWRATVGAGTLLGDLDERMHKAGGRAIAHGTCPQVGIGGHATIGGLGPISRLWGLALDHIEEVEVVLANGTITRSNPNLHPDIFFAVKGAAASFGIVTEFVLKTHPEPTNEMVHYSYNIQLGTHASMAPTFAAWQSLISDPNLTWKLASQVIVSELLMIISGTYFGPKAEFQALRFEEKLRLNTSNTTVVLLPLTSWLGSITNWAENEVLKVIGGLPAPFYSKSLAFRRDTLIPTQGIQNFFKYLDKLDKGTPIWFAIFDLEAGATNAISQDATAYGHRDALFYMQTYAIGLAGVTPSIRAFVNGMNNEILKSMPENVDLGSYAGYVDPALGQQGQKAYWRSNLPKLERIKRELDPLDVFHNPQSVRPAAA